VFKARLRPLDCNHFAFDPSNFAPGKARYRLDRLIEARLRGRGKMRRREELHPQRLGKPSPCE